MVKQLHATGHRVTLSAFSFLSHMSGLVILVSGTCSEARTEEEDGLMYFHCVVTADRLSSPLCNKSSVISFPPTCRQFPVGQGSAALKDERGHLRRKECALYFRLRSMRLYCAWKTTPTK